MKPKWTMIVCLLLAAPLLAAPPEVPKAMQVAPGQLVRITVKTEADIGTLKNFDDEKAFFDELAPKKGERRFVFQSMNPGVYVVGFWTAGEKEGSSCTITVPGGTPAPPGPIPPDPPAPTSKVAWAIVIEESEARTVAQARVLADIPFWASLGVGWHIYDKDNPVAVSSKYVAAAAKAGALPALLLLDKDGNFLRAVKLPGTTAEVAAEVKK